MAATFVGGGGSSDTEAAGFAKLQGEDFEYYMQTYSIILGRSSKNSAVDLDLASLGGGMGISRHHARIFYDFPRRRFALEVIGKNGCLVEGVHHLPGNPPVKLDSQDLLQMGDKKFYFLLPSRSILAPATVPRQHLVPALRPPFSGYDHGDEGADESDGFDDDDSMDNDEEVGQFPGSSMQLENRSEKTSKTNREADNYQLLQLEEKDVVSAVATVLSDLCGPGEWMPMEELHAVLVEQYGNLWHHSRVRRYLTSEDWPLNESKGSPWFGLLMLLRRYPEQFVINTRSKGRLISEFVSLVSLIS